MLFWVVEQTTWSKRLRAWLGSKRLWPVLFLGLPASKDTFNQLEPRTPPDQCFTGLQNNDVVETIARVAGVETTLASSLPGIASIQGHLQSVGTKDAPRSVLYWVAEQRRGRNDCARGWGRNDFGQFSSWDCQHPRKPLIGWTQGRPPISSFIGLRNNDVVETIARVAGVETTLASSLPGIASIRGHLRSVGPKDAPRSVLYWVAEQRRGRN